MLCPCDTPEGSGCGLIKNLALLTHITTDEEETPIRAIAYDLGVEDIRLLSGAEINAASNAMVFFNGQILGVHREPQRFISQFRFLRRRGQIPVRDQAEYSRVSAPGLTRARVCVRVGARDDSASYRCITNRTIERCILHRITAVSAAR